MTGQLMCQEKRLNPSVGFHVQQHLGTAGMGCSTFPAQRESIASTFGEAIVAGGRVPLQKIAARIILNTNVQTGQW